MSRASGWAACLLGSAGLAMGLGLGCLLQLHHEIACGDGYLDRVAGEECDPGDPDSYESACVGVGFPHGIAACDPIECTIIADADQCERCGDGLLQKGNLVEELETDGSDSDTEGLREECDRGDYLETCPNGGTMACDSRCQLDYGGCLPFCGDGVQLGAEECGEADPGSIATQKHCAPNADGDTGVSSPTGFEYGSGIAQCVGCMWTREHCSYCGNGRRDDALIVDFATGLMSLDEWCDGDDLDLGRLVSKYGQSCANENENWQPNARCAGCFDFEMENEAEPCCVRSAAYCPLPTDSVKCCYAYEHPEDPEPCLPQGVVPPICKGAD